MSGDGDGAVEGDVVYEDHSTTSRNLEEHVLRLQAEGEEDCNDGNRVEPVVEDSDDDEEDDDDDGNQQQESVAAASVSPPIDPATVPLPTGTPTASLQTGTPTVPPPDNKILHQQFAAAKKCITLNHHTNRRSNGSGHSGVFDYMMIASFVSRDKKLELSELDIDAFNRIESQNSQKKMFCFVCTICYANETMSLDECMRGPIEPHAGNLDSHNVRIHDFCARVGGTPGDGSRYNSKKTKRRATDTTSVSLSTTKRAKTSAPVPSVGREGGGVCPSPMSFTGLPATGVARLPYLTTGQQSIVDMNVSQAVRHLNKLQFRFANNNNIAQRAITDSACPEFREAFDFAVAASDLLKKAKSIHMGKDMYTSLRKDDYETIMTTVGDMARHARDAYSNLAGKPISFVTVGHDGWDSKQKDLVGVTPYFYIPGTGKVCKAPVGLFNCKNKKAQETAEDCEGILKSAGIYTPDNFRTVNDTTPTAVAVGRILTGTNGTCLMHRCQLIMEHATGKRTRKRNNAVVDSFEACEKVRKAARVAASDLMTGKSRGRYHFYERSMNDAGRHAKRLPLPNETRCAGFHLFYEALIESCWNLRLYWYQNQKAKRIDDDTFACISQMASALYPLSILIKKVQTDNFGSIAYSFVHSFRVYVQYATLSFLYCAVLDPTLVRQNKQWHAGASYPVRDWRGTPVLLPMPEGNITTMTMAKVPRENLMEVPKKLLERIEIEFREYAATPKDDQLLAMACNPLAMTVLFNELKLFSSLLEVRGHQDTHKFALGWAFKDKAKELLLKHLREICDQHPMVKAAASGIPVGETTQAVLAGDDDDPLSSLRMQQQHQVTVSSTDPIKKEVDDFFELLNISWDSVLTDQGVEPYIVAEIGSTPPEWQSNWQLISDHFNIMWWWEKVGRIKFPLIFIAACQIHALPESNGDQERTFSAATWMDDPRRRRQMDATFQMKVLIYKNKDLLKGVASNDSSKKVKAKAAKELVKSSKTRLTAGSLSGGSTSAVAGPNSAVDLPDEIADDYVDLDDSSVESIDVFESEEEELLKAIAREASEED